MAQIPIRDANGNIVNIDVDLEPDGSNQQKVVLSDIAIAIMLALEQISQLAMAMDPSTGRLRALIEANTAANQSMNLAQIGGAAVAAATAQLGINIAQVLGTALSVGAGVTGAGVPRVQLAQESGLFDLMSTNYANSIRPRIT